MSLFLSFTFYYRLHTTRFQSIKRPQHKWITEEIKKKKKLEKNDKENITPQNLFVVFIKLLSPVPTFATPWAAARQAPLSTISQFPQIHIHGATDAI